MADFVKYQALGNDYLIVDPARIPSAAGGSLAGTLAKLLCDRHCGVGADGVLFGPLSAPAPGEPVEVLIFNSDGSACAKSGNGVRMFALYLAEHRGFRGAVTVRTVGGDCAVEIRDVRAGLVRATLGPAVFGERGLRLDLGGHLSGLGEVSVTTLSNGNPHAVVFRDDVSRALAHELGEPIAGHARFPGRINAQFARVVDRTTIELQTWERGAGYTLASGAGACAAASAAFDLGMVDGTVEVRMPGGSVTVEAGGEDVALTGAVEAVAAGDFAPAFRDRLGLLRPVV